MTGINLLNLKTGQYFRTLLTDRVGHVVEKEKYRIRVKWNDLKGPGYVHRNLVVEPWPRQEPDMNKPENRDALMRAVVRRSLEDEGPGGW